MKTLARLFARLGSVTQSLLVGAALTGVYFLMVLTGEFLGLPAFVPRVLFWSVLLGLMLVVWRRIALARLSTSTALRGGDQISDEPIKVPVPSGTLVLGDLATLRNWRGSRPLESTEFADLELVGPKARPVARSLGLNGPHLYDVPVEALEEVRSTFSSRARKRSPRLSVRQSDVQVTHRARAQRAAQAGPDLFNLRANEVLALPAARVEVTRSWLVTGELDTLDVSWADKPVTRLVPLGTMDLATDVIVLADLDALESFSTEVSRDDHYDLLVRGQVSSMAPAVGGTIVHPGLWTWSNLTLEHARQIQELFADEHAVSLLIPHSDEYFLAAQLELGSVAELELPSGPLLALRAADPGTRVVALEYHEQELVGLRVHYRADARDVYVLPGPGPLERLLTPILTRRRA